MYFFCIGKKTYYFSMFFGAEKELFQLVTLSRPKMTLNHILQDTTLEIQIVFHLSIAEKIELR